MIFEWLMDAAYAICSALFMIIDILPEFPSSLTSSIDGVFEIMYQGVSVVGFFVDMNVVKVLIPIVIAIINFDKIVKLVIFILKKIPVLGIE